MKYKRFFLDTEFNDNGKYIDLISIGLICEDGSHYYALNADADHENNLKNLWLENNVYKHIDTNRLYLLRESLKLPFSEFAERDIYLDGWRSLKLMSEELLNFIRPDLCCPIIWVDYSAYDHVAFCQIFGTMSDLPGGMPMHTRDLRTVIEDLGIEDNMLPEQEEETKHHALYDAGWNAKVFYWLRDNYSHPSLNFGS